MSLFGQPGNPRRKVSEGDVKLCALCGALNYHRNGECFTCGWRGVFERDAAVIHLAWQRLTEEFTTVEMEHITAARASGYHPVGSPVSEATPSWMTKVSDWWRALIAQRSKPGAGAVTVRSHSGPPNELGV